MADHSIIPSSSITSDGRPPLPDQSGKPWGIHRENPIRAARLLQQAVQEGDPDAIALVRLVIFDARADQQDAPIADIGLMKFQHVIARLNEATKWTTMATVTANINGRLPGQIVVVGASGSGKTTTCFSLIHALRMRNPATRTVMFRAEPVGSSHVVPSDILFPPELPPGIRPQDIVILTTPSQLAKRRHQFPEYRHEVFSIRPTTLTTDDWMDILECTLFEDLRSGSLEEENVVEEELEFTELKFATNMQEIVRKTVEDGLARTPGQGATLADIEAAIQTLAEQSDPIFARQMESVRNGLARHRWFLDEQNPDVSAFIGDVPHVVIILGGEETIWQESDGWDGLLSLELDVLCPFVIKSIVRAKGQRRKGQRRLDPPTTCLFQGCESYIDRNKVYHRLISEMRGARHNNISTLFETQDPGVIPQNILDLTNHYVLHCYKGQDLTWLKRLALDDAQEMEVKSTLHRLPPGRCIIWSPRERRLILDGRFTPAPGAEVVHNG